MTKIDDIFSMPDYRRQKMRLGRRRGKYHCEKRPKFSREELLDYLRKNNFLTQQQLEANRKPGEPKRYEYLREFGSWRNAKMNAFGIPPAPTDASYIYKAIVEFDLWTEKAYLEARKKRPDVLPPIHIVRKRWGRYRTVKEVARRHSIKILIELYWKLKRKLGRHPDLNECKVAGVHLEEAVGFFGSKRKLEKFVESLEAQDEKQRGNP